MAHVRRQACERLPHAVGNIRYGDRFDFTAEALELIERAWGFDTEDKNLAHSKYSELEVLGIARAPIDDERVVEWRRSTVEFLKECLTKNCLSKYQRLANGSEQSKTHFSKALLSLFQSFHPDVLRTACKQVFKTDDEVPRSSDWQPDIVKQAITRAGGTNPGGWCVVNHRRFGTVYFNPCGGHCFKDRPVPDVTFDAQRSSIESLLQELTKEEYQLDLMRYERSSQ